MKRVWVKAALPVLVLALGFGGMAAIEASAQQNEEKEQVDTRPTVKVEAVQAQDYQVLITSHGEVQALEMTNLAAQVSGEVTSWHPEFVPGGLVRRGEVLFSIEKDSYQAALLQAQANLSLAKANLIQEQARGEVAANEAKNLPKDKVTDLYLRKPQLLSAQAELKSAQARLKIAERDLANCEVTAPYDALVLTRNLGSGQYVSQGMGVAQLNNIETAEVVFPIAGFDYAFLPDRMQGMQANIVSKGINGFTREAVIARDLGVVDKATRMSQMVVRIDDPYSLNSTLPPVKFGSYVEVNFAGKTLQHIYRLPQELVNNRTVWLIDQDNKLQPRKVEVMREEGAYLLISDGLSDQDKIVITVPEYPQKGMEVKLAGVDEQNGSAANAANTSLASANL